MAGCMEPKPGRAGRQAKVRTAIRTVILIAFGTVMTIAYKYVAIRYSYLWDYETCFFAA